MSAADNCLVAANTDPVNDCTAQNNPRVARDKPATHFPARLCRTRSTDVGLRNVLPSFPALYSPPPTSLLCHHGAAA